MAVYLAFKEVWRMKGRYLLFSLVIALITVLVLFIAALAGGLANANKQFIDKLDANMLVYQENVDLQPTASRLGRAKLTKLRRVEGIKDIGPLAFSTATIVFPDGRDFADISLIGVEVGKPGDSELLSGTGLRSKRTNDAVIDLDLATRANISLGERILVKTVQGTEEELFEMNVVGITDSRQYFFLPSVIVPLEAWDRIRPQGEFENQSNGVVFNMIAVQLENPDQFDLIEQRIMRLVDGVEVANKREAIEALPGYSAQQSTLNTQQAFTLLIGVLVVGGFFQIQTLQKVAQIGVLKAIGSPSGVVATTVLLQIIIVTILGISIGSMGTYLLTLGMPAGIPIMFTGPTVFSAVAALALIGPLGGLVSIRLALKIDPLTAIGLSS